MRLDIDEINPTILWDIMGPLAPSDSTTGGITKPSHRDARLTDWRAMRSQLHHALFKACPWI